MSSERLPMPSEYLFPPTSTNFKCQLRRLYRVLECGMAKTLKLTQPLFVTELVEDYGTPHTKSLSDHFDAINLCQGE